MIVASSTPSNQLELTAALLDQAPVGARLWLGYSRSACSTWVRVEDGWACNEDNRHLLVQTGSILFGWGDSDLSMLSWTLHHPGLVRVALSVDPVLGRHWVWACQCGDGLAYLASLAAAADHARAHVINHAETGLVPA